MSEIDNLVLMATEVNHEALHEFLLQKCKEQTMEFSKINKQKQDFTSVIKEGSNNSEQILASKVRFNN